MNNNLLQFVYSILKNVYIFVYLTFNSSIPSFKVPRRKSYCFFLHIEKKKKKSIHISINSIHKLMGWFALQMLLSAEMYWMLSILSPFLQSVGKSMHAAIICLGIQTDSFTSTIIHSSGRSLIPFGQYNTKRLFCNFLVVFAYYYRK